MTRLIDESEGDGGDEGGEGGEGDGVDAMGGKPPLHEYLQYPCPFRAATSTYLIYRW